MGAVILKYFSMTASPRILIFFFFFFISTCVKVVCIRIHMPLQEAFSEKMSQVVRVPVSASVTERMT